MMNIRLVCVGKLKEKYFLEAVSEYQKRLSTLCKLEIIEVAEQRLPESPTLSQIKVALEKEASEIRLKIPKGAITVAMCIEGKEISSNEMAEGLSYWAVNGNSNICFIIGGSFGLGEDIKEYASLKLSMSRMTFPHNLARVVLLEQIYRAFSILKGAKYHK